MDALFTDPKGWRINVNSFQQDAIVTFKDYQYAAGYNAQRRVVLGRHRLPKGEWQFFEFDDYQQELDDGHNTVSMGISGDGILHLSWDLHNSVINYRHSLVDVNSSDVFDQTIFGPNLKKLQNLNLSQVTYPRFIRDESTGDLILELRIGRSGLGDDYLYKYSRESQQWQPIGDHNGMYLKGIACNAYINGFDIDSRNGWYHVSWTYRDFVEDGFNPGKVSVQAGPNGPENNHDLYYMYSPDNGLTWYNSSGKKLVTPVDPSQDTKVFEIPKYSGIMNQEGQALDKSGNFHVLNREKGWYHHYWRSADNGTWTDNKLPYEAVEFGERGQLVGYGEREILALLPGNNGNDAFTILRLFGDKFDQSAVVYQEKGYSGEPLYDRYRNDGILSVIQRGPIFGTKTKSIEPVDEDHKDLVGVLHFDLGTMALSK